MRVIISDASTLILLEKIKLLSLILKKDKIVIPQGVYEEAVIRGKMKKFADAFEIDNKINKGQIQVFNIQNKSKLNEIMKNFNLAVGETESIVLYYEKKGDLIALDDLKAMKYCDYYGLPFVTAVNLVLDSFNRNRVSKSEARKMIKNLGIYGRYKSEILFYALDKIKSD